MVIFHSYVSLPEGIFNESCLGYPPTVAFPGQSESRSLAFLGEQHKQAWLETTLETSLRKSGSAVVGRFFESCLLGTRNFSTTGHGSRCKHRNIFLWKKLGISLNFMAISGNL